MLSSPSPNTADSTPDPCSQPRDNHLALQSPEIPSITVKIASSASIASLLNSWPLGPSDVDPIPPSTPPATGSDARPVHHSVITDSSNHAIDNGGLDLLAAASREPGSIEAPPLPQPRRADQPRMRSSIACARCRRSKVKCLNNGVNTPCRACMVSGRECVYPTPASADRSHRRDGSLGRAADQLLGTPDGQRSARSKPKKSQSMFLGSHSSSRAPVDALSTSVVTPQVWLELFEIWQQHFSIDLPFLHPTSFTKLLREARGAPAQQDFNTPKVESPHDLPAVPTELLLGILTLTSRFHPALVAHHSPASSSRSSSPLIATEYYAAVCRDKLLSLSDATPDLARVQSLLMLAFHEWGDCQTTRAWTYLGEALRYAKLLGYGEPDEVDDRISIVQQIISSPLGYIPGSEDVLQEQETRRRTFWACFTLERNLSSGTFRPLSIHAGDVRVPLPVSEKSYLFNERARTPLICEWADESHRLNGEHKSASVGSARTTPAPINSPRGREGYDDLLYETGQNEGALSRYVKASEIFNNVLQWAGRGGRLNEKFPPWDHQSTWHGLYRSVSNLIEKLPRELTLSQANISAHITTRSSVSFTLLHTSLLLSKMILLREFLPFLPIKVTHPKGPVDNLSPFSAAQAPESALGFWSDSAVEIFKSARDLLNLFLTCSEWKLLAETPLVGFASYMIATLGVYSTHFPWMDTKELMSSSVLSQGNPGFMGTYNIRDAETAKKAAELVAGFRPKFKMAEGWFKTLGRLHHLFLRTKRELRRNSKHPNMYSPSEAYQGRSQLLTLRMTDESYMQLDHVFGPDHTQSQDLEMVDATDVKPGPQANRGQTETVARESWAAVNAPHPAQTQDSNGMGYHQGQQSPGASRSNYPPISPQAPSQPYTPSSLPQFPYSSPYPQPKSPSGAVHPPEPTQDTQSTPRLPSQPWTQEQVEAWLNSLETVFGANDVVVFAEAIDWKEFVVPGSPIKGWLRLAWTG